MERTKPHYTEDEVKERLDSLQQAMVMDRGKDLCDLLKVHILDSLIKLSERREPNLLLKEELEAIRDGIEELRGKEKEEAVQAIASVFDRLLERGNADAQIQERK